MNFKLICASFLMLLLPTCGFSQIVRIASDSIPYVQNNAAQTLLTASAQNSLTIGMYGEVEYLKPQDQNGVLDVHRMVLLLGYRFDERVQFITEIEMEHTTELYVEQAFVNYNVSDALNLRAGLLLVPMGIINEYHEPTTFNGVSRPIGDTYLVPTTWREIGAGIAGRFDNLSMRYQAYVVNGFASENKGKVLNGENGLRNGRQKGGKSIINSPNFSVKFDYYGLRNLRVGLSYYVGQTQSDLEKTDLDVENVGVNMVGLDARYSNGSFAARGQYIHARLSNTSSYNDLYDSDLGSKMYGWYLEGSFKILDFGNNRSLTLFSRYENVDTHAAVINQLKNGAYHRNSVTSGFGLALTQGVVFKTDYQRHWNAANDKYGQFNMGVGFWY